MDIPEQKKTLVEKTAAADLPAARCLETIPEAFVLWDAENRLVLCNSNFQALHNLPYEALTSGIPYEKLSPRAADTYAHQVHGPQVPGARTF